ncbi:MAG: hypothetical protein F9K18_14935, partial [Thermoanaerobaculia bacterium]
MWGISRSGGESLGFLTRSGVRPKACLPVLSLLLLPASFLGAATAPVVDSLSATPSTVAPGGTVTIAVAAHDPDCTTPPCTTGCGQYVRADLTLWSASDGTFTAWDNGTSGSPYAASASWQAPAVEGSYLVTVQLSDSGSFLCGDRQTTLASLPVQVSTVVNLPPVIASLTAQPALIFPGGTSQLACAATDPEGQPLDFAWSSDLGTVSAGEGGAATFTAPAPGLATVTCTASDPDGGVASSSVAVSISSVRVERTLEGPFVAPQRLALDARGRLWVADRGAGGLVELE